MKGEDSNNATASRLSKPLGGDTAPSLTSAELGMSAHRLIVSVCVKINGETSN